jgi:hypothetical protein
MHSQQYENITNIVSRVFIEEAERELDMEIVSGISASPIANGVYDQHGVTNNINRTGEDSVSMEEEPGITEGPLMELTNMYMVPGWDQVR